MPNLTTILDDAQRLQRDGAWAKAEVLYRQVLRADPYNAEAAFLLAGCCQAQNKTRDALTFIDKALQLQPNYAEAHHARALVFGANNDLSEAVAELIEAIRLKPDYAEAHHNLGVTFARQKRLDKAIEAFANAVRCKPDYADAILNLAHACDEKGRADEAIEAYRKLLQLQPHDAAVHNALGLLLTKRHRMVEAIVEFHQAVGIEANNAIYQNNLGAAMADLGRPREAVAYFDAALALNADHADAHKNRAMTLLNLGDFEHGWQEFEWRWQCKDFKPAAFREPAWDGGPLDGRRILINTEQGIGDAFQFVRYAALLAERGAHVILQCPARLVQLMRTCPGVAVVVPQGTPLPPFDCHVSLMSLPRLLGTTLETVPTAQAYLSAEGGLVERWGREFGGGEVGRPAPAREPPPAPPW